MLQQSIERKGDAFGVLKWSTKVLHFVGASSGGKPRSSPEIALDHCVAKGVVPPPGYRTEGQVRNIVSAFDLYLGKYYTPLPEERLDCVLTMAAGA